MVDEVFDSALAGLKPEDRDLRIVQVSSQLCSRRAGCVGTQSTELPC